MFPTRKPAQRLQLSTKSARVQWFSDLDGDVVTSLRCSDGVVRSTVPGSGDGLRRVGPAVGVVLTMVDASESFELLEVLSEAAVTDRPLWVQAVGDWWMVYDPVSRTTLSGMSLSDVDIYEGLSDKP